MPLAPDDVRTLVMWIGEEGARLGLEKSDMSAPELHAIALAVGAKVPAKARRKDIALEIVFAATRRIDRTIEELMELNPDDLLKYFEQNRPSKKELLAVLGEIDFHPNSEAQKSLYRYAARQIAETGMFQRVARGGATAGGRKPA